MVDWAAVQGAELPEKTHIYDNYKTKLCLDDKFKLLISDIWCSYMQIQQPRKAELAAACFVHWSPISERPEVMTAVFEMKANWSLYFGTFYLVSFSDLTRQAHESYVLGWCYSRDERQKGSLGDSWCMQITIKSSTREPRLKSQLLLHTK